MITKWLRRAWRWFSTPAKTDPPLRCVYCGEERLIERDDRGWYCSVCGRGGRFADDPRRKHLNRVMGREW